MDCLINAPEGIDTVSFQLNDIYIVKGLWHYYGNLISYAKLSQSYGMKRIFYVDVQFEALNMFGNIRSQIIWIIVVLYFSGVLQFPNMTTQCSFNEVSDFVNKNLGNIAKLTALDFFFDFARKDVEKYDLPNNYPTTNYSIDHKKSKSLWIIYDRAVNLKRQRHIAYKTIDAMPYPMRIELRLNRQSCKYLNFENINGSYYDIAFRFYNYIARSWRKYNSQLGAPQSTNYHFVFNNVLYTSQQNHIPMSNLQLSDTLF